MEASRHFVEDDETKKPSDFDILVRYFSKEINALEEKSQNPWLTKATSLKIIADEQIKNLKEHTAYIIYDVLEKETYIKYNPLSTYNNL
jgi:hypothetical protein